MYLINPKEKNTILAALRYLQANLDDAKEAMSDFNDSSLDEGETTPDLLIESEIDALYGKINTEPCQL